jgi:hypothetical protein
MVLLCRILKGCQARPRRLWSRAWLQRRKYRSCFNTLPSCDNWLMKTFRNTKTTWQWEETCLICCLKKSNPSVSNSLAFVYIDLDSKDVLIDSHQSPSKCLGKWDGFLFRQSQSKFLMQVYKIKQFCQRKLWSCKWAVYAITRQPWNTAAISNKKSFDVNIHVFTTSKMFLPVDVCWYSTIF